ncbi:MAG: hypothetical protein V2A74_08265 [bacterium]
MNSVPPKFICNTEASAASERFIHIEQDLEVRQEPQHIIDAIEQTLQQTQPAAASHWLFY